MGQFEKWEANWDDLLAKLGVSVRTLVYEDLDGAWDRGVAEIAEAVGVELSAAARARIAVATTRQSDHSTDAFLEGFRAWTLGR